MYTFLIEKTASIVDRDSQIEVVSQIKKKG